jgi:hypothetical protein
MVSQREPGRRSELSVRIAGALLFLLVGCSRRAEIENAPDAGTVPVMEFPKPDGGVPPVEDVELDHPDGLTCGERPRSALCAGANDFGCDFDGWFQRVATECQQQTDCHTDGWVEATVDGDGCASELRMEDPDPDFVSCVTTELAQYQCPCDNVVGSIYLGLANDGCPGTSCGTGELRCAPGSTCRNGECVESPMASGGAGAG